MSAPRPQYNIDFHQQHSGNANAALKYNWPLVSTLWLLLAIPGIPAILIVSLLLVGPVESTLLMSLLNPLYLSAPWAVIVHGSCGAIFFLTMPWQFSPALRHKYPKWHRGSGRLVLLSGYSLAISGVWMHLFLTPDQLGMRFIGLLALCCGMVLAFSMAFYAVLNRQFDRHQRWMCRAVAITLATITPLFIEVMVGLSLGQIAAIKPSLAVFFHDYGRLLGISLNLLIGEWLMRQKVQRQMTLTLHSDL